MKFALAVVTVIILLLVEIVARNERMAAPRVQRAQLLATPQISSPAATTRINLPLVGRDFTLPPTQPILLTGYDVLFAQTLQGDVPLAGQTVTFEQCKRIESPCTEWYPPFSGVTGNTDFGGGIFGAVGKSGILIRITACAQNQVIMTQANQFKVVPFQCP